MKTPLFRLAMLGALVACMGGRICVAAGGGTVVAVGGRTHVDHSVYPGLPFGDDDIGYGAALEYRERNAAWQLALDYVPDGGVSNEYDTIITPQLNLIFSDRAWRGGAGILSTYTDTKDGDSKWSDIYYQFMLGFGMPFFMDTTLEAFAYYTFEDFNMLDEFDFGDLEFGAWVGYAF